MRCTNRCFSLCVFTWDINLLSFIISVIRSSNCYFCLVVEWVGISLLRWKSKVLHAILNLEKIGFHFLQFFAFNFHFLLLFFQFLLFFLFVFFSFRSPNQNFSSDTSGESNKSITNECSLYEDESNFSFKSKKQSLVIKRFIK